MKPNLALPCSIRKQSVDDKIDARHSNMLLLVEACYVPGTTPYVIEAFWIEKRRHQTV